MAAVKITLVMIQPAVEAALASVRKRLCLEYVLIDRSLDLGPACKIEGTGRVIVSSRLQ